MAAGQQLADSNTTLCQPHTFSSSRTENGNNHDIMNDFHNILTIEGPTTKLLSQADHFAT